jgi:Alpha-L-fucosidase
MSSTNSVSRLSRKQFLRALATVGTAFVSVGPNHAFELPGSPRMEATALITRLNSIISLYPAQAQDIGKATQLDKMRTAAQWFGPGTMRWTVTVEEPGNYRVRLCYSSTVPGSRIEVHGETSVWHEVRETEGCFLPQGSGWAAHQYWNFERVPVEGDLLLSRGVNVISLNLMGRSGEEILRLRSVELYPRSQDRSIRAWEERARRQRASTDWLVRAGYGVMFHWIDATAPAHGPRRPYAEAVEALDVEALASLVEEIGAGYVIFTGNHGHPHFPAPIRSWEDLHPGWTTRRDLISDLAEALNRRSIKLMLFINCPGLGNLVQLPGMSLDSPTFSEERYTHILSTVLTEIGLRYKERLVGYYCDSWFQTGESYPNLPFDLLSEALRAGNPERLISYNYWVFPIGTQWQDYWFGEVGTSLVKRFGSRYIERGAGEGLQAHSTLMLDTHWFHTKLDTPMEPPLFTKEQLIDYVRLCMEDKAVVTINVGIFQEGTIGEASRQLLRELKHAVR